MAPLLPRPAAGGCSKAVFSCQLLPACAYTAGLGVGESELPLLSPTLRPFAPLLRWERRTDLLPFPGRQRFLLGWVVASPHATLATLCNLPACPALCIPVQLPEAHFSELVHL